MNNSRLNPEIIKYKEIDSTNNEAVRLLNKKKSFPYWIVAEKQTDGKGRKNRYWDSLVGNFMGTYVLEINLERKFLPHLAFVCALAIYDTMQYIKPDISTVCFGQAASMGSLLLTSGAKGKRFSLPNSRIMLHQPSGGFQGQATDIEIHAKEILDLKSRLNEIYNKHTGKPIKDIEKALERDNFLKPEDAKNFGLIDHVVDKRDTSEK